MMGVPVDRNDLTLSEKDRKQLISWALECADRLLVIFSSHHLVNRRLSNILEQAKGFGSGEVRIGQMRTLALECHQIARDCDSPVPTAVARTCGHAIAIAHMAGHSRNVPKYAAKALAAVDCVDKACELAWQKSQLPERFRDFVFGA